MLYPFYRKNNGGGNIYQWGRIFACRDSGFVQQKGQQDAKQASVLVILMGRALLPLAIVQTRFALSALSGRVVLRSNGLSAIAFHALTINPLELTKPESAFNLLRRLSGRVLQLNSACSATNSIFTAIKISPKMVESGIL
ncbi:MAG: hypothetical protein DRP37_06185 [Thermodesulfobacteriota bacterium]|nr:MAG: hypothetical protein DRP37_06185 [Thermodesulfobacteriota bacterium]